MSIGRRGIALCLELLAAGAIASGCTVASESAQLQSVSPASALRESSAEQALEGVDPELLAVSQVRGLPVLRPVNAVRLGRREIAERALGIARANSSESALRANVTFLRMLGLVPDGFEWERAARTLFEVHLAGLYDASASQVLITQGNPSAEALVRLHEFTHALQDQHFEIGRRLRWSPGQGDRLAALQALSEGEATLVQRLAFTENPPRSEHATEEGPSASIPEVLLESSASLYRDGLAFVQALLDREGWSAVDAAWRAPPESTEQLLHPERYWARETFRRFPAPALPEGCTRVAWDVVGEQGLRTVLRQWAEPSLADSAAAGWDGDRLDVFECGGAAQVRWQIGFDSAADVAEAELALRGAAVLCPATGTAGQVRALAISGSETDGCLRVLHE